MAVAFRSVSTAASGSAVGSLACPIPLGTVSGDVLVLVCEGFRNGGGHVPSVTGWTRHAHHVNPSTNDNFSLFSKVADGTEGANVTITFTQSDVWICVGILAYSGGAIDAFSDFGSVQATATPTVPSVTTTAANDMVVGVAIMETANSATQASGWTERLDFKQPSVGSLVYAMEKAQAAAGASPTALPTASGSSNTWTYAFAIKETGGGGGGGEATGPLSARRAGAAHVDPASFNAVVDAVVALGGSVRDRKAGAAAVDSDDFNAVVDAVVLLGGSVRDRKAGSASPDPDDFNALVNAVVTLQG